MEVQTNRPEGQTATQVNQVATQSAPERLRKAMESLSVLAEAELKQACKSKGVSHTERYISALEYQNRQLLEAWREQYPEDVEGLQYSEGISVELPRTPERVPQTATIGGISVLVSEDTARLIALSRAIEDFTFELCDELGRIAGSSASERARDIGWDLHGLMSDVIGQRVTEDYRRHDKQGYILI